MSLKTEQYQVHHLDEPMDCDSKNWRWLDCEECAFDNEICNMKVCIDCGGEVETIGESR